MKKRKIFAVIIICIVSISPVLACDEEGEENRQTMFSIALLSPNTLEARNQWALLMQEQLPKIGIGVYLHESTGWGNIAPRTWNYPLIDFDYIPTYAEGGYDILFIGRDWEKDFNPTGFFDLSHLYLFENFYQYYNNIYDSVLNEYLISYDPSVREQQAYALQTILYVDLPAISILYDQEIFLLKQEVSGVDFDLLNIRCHHSENWEKASSSNLIYGCKYDLNIYNTFNIEKERYRDSYVGFDNLWTQFVYGSLYQRNLSTHSWEPYIARNATITPNFSETGYLHNVSVIVDINPEARFSNGDEVLAEDIKYSYDLHLSPNAHSSTYSNLVKEFLGWSNDSIVEIDSDTVRFDFDRQSNFPYSVLSYGIIDKSIVEPIISSYGYAVYDQLPFSANVSDTLVTSCGPFKLESYNISDGKVELILNEYWSGSAQQLSNITFISIPNRDEALTRFIEGEIDILDISYEYLNSDILSIPDFELTYKKELCKSLSHQEMAINMKYPIIGTGELTPVGTSEAAKYMRCAISHAIPRQYIIDEFLEGMGSPGVTPIPHGCIGFDNSLEPYAYDLDLAIDYTEQAGYTYCIPCTSPSNLLMLPFLIGLAYISILRWKKI